MKRSLLIFAALAAWTACAQSARLGSLGRNDMVVTNIGEIARAASYGTDTQWTDATGCVWKVVDYGETWRVAYNSVGVRFVETPVWREPPDEMVPGWYAYGIEHGYQLASTNYNATLTDIKSYSGGVYDDVSGEMVYYTGDVSWMRGVQTILAGRVAMTNDIPRTPGAVGAYPAASGSALESGKQDRLPYPTNAIPFSAIDGAPSGGGTPEWRVEELESQYDTVIFVTNGMVKVEVSDVLITSIIGWPEGAAMFVQGRVVGEYTPVQQLRLVGYGTWPTNNFQSVWWRSGTNIYVNVILEE